ncbi:MAG: hypothetical protein WC683_08085 [bacterium]
MADHYTVAQFLAAIPGSGGLVTAIAKKAGVDWHTARKYITKHVTLQEAIAEEREKSVDLAEAVVIRNIQLASRQQNEPDATPVDSADARWFLSMQGKNRGYTTRQELTGADGGPLIVKRLANVSTDDL